MKSLIFFVLCSTATAVGAEERVDLTVPFDPDARSTSVLRVNSLLLRWGATVSQSLISVQLSSGSITLDFNYYGQDARTQMIALNKANLTTNSLQKRIMNKLISDGLIDGTVSGTPD